MEYACGNSIVCDTLQEARELCFSGEKRYKCVTLDGTLIRKSGMSVVLWPGSHVLCLPGGMGAER